MVEGRSITDLKIGVNPWVGKFKTTDGLRAWVAAIICLQRLLSSAWSNWIPPVSSYKCVSQGTSCNFKIKS